MLDIVVTCRLLASEMLFLWTKQMKADVHSILFCVSWSDAGRPKVCILFRNSNDHELCCILNHENILLPFRCRQLLLFDQPESILPPVAQLILSRSKLDDHFDLHQQFGMFLRTFLHPIVH
ncbi:hypothetical protein TNIN_81261 [Trichonephila inaurata madagascariensis]|uniref:Uncharacterized protein n=1 Tax=Trichonephila inaurata madagascariensis TaxID=2747483 RepID=A0A8X6YMC6_9ARAC|nr:hypothetical protein TNIN_81261 [Trichonephila inaurata madagascariensis]